MSPSLAATQALNFAGQFAKRLCIAVARQLIDHWHYHKHQSWHQQLL
jgi:hypothetical protein